MVAPHALLRQGTESTNSFGRSVAFAKRRVHLQYVNHLFPCQPAERSLGIGPKYLVDFPADRRGITLGVSGPFGSNSIQLVFSILKGNVGIEARTRCRHQITSNVL